MIIIVQKRNMNTSWKYEIRQYRKEQNHFLEAIFTQSNGYLGIRGYHEEGIPGYDGIPAVPSAEKIESNP